MERRVYMVQGEVGLVVGAIKRNSRWNTHTPLDEEQDPLLNSFSQLKDVLNNIKVCGSVGPERPGGNQVCTYQRPALHQRIRSLKMELTR
uniref:Uncharacterized protein n=1 Tax=Knipowitschia caucasica TaxID=637954 RepID=A0AAV2JLU2_KNICA